MCAIERTHTMHTYVYTERGCSRALKQVRHEDENLLASTPPQPKQSPQKTGHITKIIVGSFFMPRIGTHRPVSRPSRDMKLWPALPLKCLLLNFELATLLIALNLNRMFRLYLICAISSS